MRRTTRLITAAAGPLLAGGLGGVASRRAPEVYAALDKPRWAPPQRVFGPVWSVLYLLLGVVGWRLTAPRAARSTRGLHAGQLVLNAAWPAAFFAARRRGTALAIIAALDLTVTAELVSAARRDPTTAALLAPYLAWSLYATALNAAVGDPRDG